MSDSPHSTPLAPSYDGSPVCRRCANGLPICADFKTGHPEAHAQTCAVYQWADDVCASCEQALARVYRTTGAGRPTSPAEREAVTAWLETRRRNREGD